MKILRARLFDMAKAEQERELAAQRKSQVGTGDRSERIRTYNFPQGRVTDHRISLTLYRLDAVLQVFSTRLSTALSQLIRPNAYRQWSRNQCPSYTRCKNWLL